MTLVARSRLAARPATCGAKPSSLNAATLSSTVRPALGAGDQRPVHRLGQPLLGAPLGLGHRLEPLVCHSEPLVTPRRLRTRGRASATGRLYAPCPGRPTPGDRARRRRSLGGMSEPDIVPLTPEQKAARAASFGGAASHYAALPPGSPGRGGGLDPPGPRADGGRPRCRHGRPDAAPGRAGRRGGGRGARRSHAGGARRVGPRGAGRGGPRRVDPAPRRQRGCRRGVVLLALDGHRPHPARGRPGPAPRRHAGRGLVRARPGVGHDRPGAGAPRWRGCVLHGRTEPG